MSGDPNADVWLLKIEADLENRPLNAALPGELAFSAYPNPFNSQAIFHFTLPAPRDVSLVLYDVLGREVRSLMSAPQPAGKHTLAFDGAGLPSGIYVARLSTPDAALTRRLLLIK